MVLMRRLVTFTKTLALGAGALTALSVAAVAIVQLRAGSFPVSLALELSGIDAPRTYVTASENRRVDPPNFYELLLDLPAIVPLFGALALLVAFYAWLVSFDKELARGPQRHW